MPEQESLIDWPAQPEQSATPVAPPRGPRKLKPIDRCQVRLLPLDVDSLLPPHHKARAIWDLTGQLDLTAFTDPIRSTQGQAGREHTDPRLLIAVWLYAYSESISSARAVSRQMEYEPGLRWLAGLEVISHTTLSAFRITHHAALDEIFTALLAVMEGAGLVDLSTVMHDGTKVQAQASRNSFRRAPALQERLERARRVVAELGDPEDENGQSRREAARRRAARERQRVLEQAVEELEQIRRQKPAGKRDEARVSHTEPEARVMRHGADGGVRPSYNAQLSTDAKQKVIVGVEVNQNSSDADVALTGVVGEIERRLDRKPKVLVVDGGYMSHDNIQRMAQAEVNLIGPLPDSEERQASARKASGITEEFARERFVRAAEEDVLVCPRQQRLKRRRVERKRGHRYVVYQAPAEACRTCECQTECCPKGAQKGRSVRVLVEECEAVTAQRAKMETEEAQAIYRRRGEVAETPNAWLKEKFGLRRFRLRGLRKVKTEMLWASLSYNVMQWIRLVWLNREAVGQAV